MSSPQFVFCCEGCVMEAYSWQLSAEVVELGDDIRHCGECDEQLLPHVSAFIGV
jgi:predicted  nucleic acid-binding Zn-ribbon protein